MFLLELRYTKSFNVFKGIRLLPRSNVSSLVYVLTRTIRQDPFDEIELDSKNEENVIALLNNKKIYEWKNENSASHYLKSFSIFKPLSNFWEIAAISIFFFNWSTSEILKFFFYYKTNQIAVIICILAT